VYSVGYAYGYNDNVPKMKTVKYGVVICTAGHPNEFLKQIGMAQSMQTILIDDRLGKRFEKKEMLILGGTLEIEKVRQQHTKQIEELVAKIRKCCA
jgi:NAD(P)H dehydrogenase (quinone)